MSKKLLKFISALVVPLFGLAQFANADENFCISVYKDGSSSQMFYFTLLSGGEYLCDNIVIDNYTGNPSDYKYWIGKNNKFEGLSANFNLGSSNSSQGTVSGTDFISSCTTGAFSVKIYSDSGDKNWYPHNWTCETAPEPGSCDVQDKGASIPANTIIFYDNSDKLFSGEIWLSVPTESGNGNASNVNQGSYYRNKDKWYQMYNVEGDIWKATITTASSYGRMSFWDKDGHESDDVFKNTVVFQAPYTTGKNIYKPDASKKCYNSNRQSDVYFKGTWDLRTGLFLNLSSTDRKIDDTNPITLKAEAIGVTGTDYTFEYRPFDSDTWTPLATQSSPEYILSGKGLPVKSTYYRVKYGTVTSSEVKLAVLINCEEGGSSKNILKYDFGTIKEEMGSDSRMSTDDMAKDYTFQPYPQLVDDGDYAIVATPYHCGCGKGKSDGCDHCHIVDDGDACKDGTGTENYWFRDIKDHTLGDKGTAGNYGGMLMINFSDAKSKIAYEHILTDLEKKAFVKGSTLSFSAYFASAAKESSTKVSINMKLMIQYKPVGSEEWITKAELENKVEYKDNWKYGITSIDIDDPSGDYRVIIENKGKAGEGDDALIDDISLDLCVPTFPVSFYDEETDSEYDTYTYTQMDETQIIRIAKQDYGHGEQNCVVLLSVDESKKAGEAGRYEFIDVMNLTSYKGADYYRTTKSVNELLGGNVGTGKLQALVTKPEICSDPTKLEDLKTELYNGDIKPLDSADYLFSTNLLTYNIVCNTTITAAFEGNTSVCEELGKKEKDLPKLNVTFGSIASYVYYSILEDGNAVVSDVDLSAAEIGAGKFSVDLNTLDQTKIVRTTGTRKFTVYMYEKASESASKICEKTSAAIDLVIKPKPTYTEIPSTVEKCEGFTQNISVSAQNTTAYTWQVKKSETSEWENAEGTNNQATYTIPETGPETGWKYRVILSNDYCTDVTSNEITLTVNVCDKVLLSINADKTELCKGEEVTFTVTITNNGTVDVNDMELTEDVSSMPGLQFVSSEKSAGTFASNKWTVSLAPSAQATLELTYKSISDVTVDNKERVFVSKLGSNTWASYDEQTDTTMKGEWAVKSKGTSSTPIITAPYNECAIDGTKPLSDLVSSDKTALQWFENPELTIVVDPATFDMSVPVKDKKYYVVNTEDGKCVSDKAEASVTVRAITSKPVTKGYNECAIDGTKPLSDLVTSDKTALEWFENPELTIVVDPATFDMSVPVKDKKYYVVNTEDGKCVSDKSEASVTVRAITPKPVTKGYNECAIDGAKQLSDLVSSDKTALQWFENPELTIVVDPATFDMSVPVKDKKYYVVNTEDGKCVSDKAEASVTVRGTTPKPVTKGYNECAIDGTKPLSDLVTSDKTALEWFENPELTIVVDPATFDMSVPVKDKKYYVVNTEDGKCVSDKAEASVTVRGTTPKPVTKGYNECAIDGTKPLSDLVTSDKTALEWFENPELTIVVDPATFDMSVPVKDKKYYVVNTEDGKCVSDKAEATVTVKDYATEADITATGQTVCKGSEVTLSASTTTVVPNPIFRWYGDAALTDKLYEGDTYKVTPNAEVTYYVSVENEDYCENKADDGKEVTISMKYPIISVLLHEKDAENEEYNLDGVPTVKRNLGMGTEKVLTINPIDVPNYSLKWYVGNSEFDGVFPRKPYIDQVYKVVVVDECGNTHIATAGTQVEWPTIFMPYDNSTNKDFVVDIDGGIELLVFDRTGNMVAHTYNGWDGFANQNGNNKIAMPGLYYYKAILPDGSVKKGNVEIFKK